MLMGVPRLIAERQAELPFFVLIQAIVHVVDCDRADGAKGSLPFSRTYPAGSAGASDTPKMQLRAEDLLNVRIAGLEQSGASFHFGLYTEVFLIPLVDNPILGMGRIWMVRK